MRIVFALLLVSFLAFVSTSQAERENSMSRIERDAGPARDQQKQSYNKKKSRTRKRRTVKKNKKARMSGPRGSARSGQGRQAFFGNGCQYVNLLEIMASGVGCENGKKFVLKGRDARRQFLIMENKVLKGRD